MVKEIEQPQLQQLPDINVNILEHGVLIGATVNAVTTLTIFLNDEVMHGLCKAYLETKAMQKQQRKQVEKVRNLRDLHA